MDTGLASMSSWPSAPPSAASLLRLFREGDSAFLSPARSVLTSGQYAVLDEDALAPVAARASRLLREVARAGEVDPLLMGAVAFGPSTPPRLFVPKGLVIGEGVKAPVGQAAAQALSSRGGSQAAAFDLVQRPAAHRYGANVEEALRAIEAGAFEKVVLARSVRLHGRVSTPRLMPTLLRRNPLGFTFAMDLGAQAQGGRTSLVGASPELLLRKRGSRVVSHPLAGSVPRAEDPEEDRRRAAALLASDKDKREHAYVVNAVAQTLSPWCRKLIVPAEPSLVATATMWHLGTHICGELHEADTSVLDMALALHPTPAVCGHPQAAAQAFLARVEGFDRRYFAGLVGWVDGRGDGEWAVTIRCAEVADTHATLYAGAGIVRGSDAALELAETEAKLRTMLGAMNDAMLREAA